MNRFVVHLELILEEMYLFILEKEQRTITEVIEFIYCFDKIHFDVNLLWYSWPVLYNVDRYPGYSRKAQIFLH